MPRSDRDPTEPFTPMLAGNELFHRAVFAIGHSGLASSTVLCETLDVVGSTPASVTIDELGAMMAELERRLRLLLPSEPAGKAIARLRTLVMRWEG